MTLVKITVAVGLGVGLGLLWTVHVLDRSNIGETIGPWTGSPHNDAGDIDPYGLAATARSGALPLGSTEGLTFVAYRDSRGSRLRATCDYSVEGPMPPARFWTLSVLTPSGFPNANASNRYGYSSAAVLRFMDEPLEIHVSQQARSGNWLPTGDARDYVLMLRLYDTSLSGAGQTLAAAVMPKIERLACR